MEPMSSELFRLSAEINLIFKKVRHRFIIKLDAYSSNFLFDRDEFSHTHQIIGLCNTKTANLIIRLVSKVE